MTASAHRPDHAELVRRFTDFAEVHRDYSPLYADLADRIAADAELLGLLAEARPGQRRPVLIFAAVHYLLLDATASAHPLAAFYPSLCDDPQRGDAWPAFRDFCLEHRETLVELISTHNTQTNEVGRCSGLYPALRLARRLAGRPLALVEIGASAGLNLRVERYAYRYSTGQRAGNRAAPLTLDCVVTGPYAPPVEPAEPAWRRSDLDLLARVGIDLSPVDIADDNAVRWLAACVYADQPERIARLRAAVDIARRDPVRIVRGDVLDVLPDIVAELPAEATPCLLHTWVATYFPRDVRSRFVAMVGELAARRPLVWIASEPAGTLPGLEEKGGSDSGSSELGLASLTGPHLRWRRLGRMHSHGAWLHWSDAESGRRLAG